MMMPMKANKMNSQIISYMKMKKIKSQNVDRFEMIHVNLISCDSQVFLGNYEI